LTRAHSSVNMFVHMGHVRNRTLPLPEEPTEHSADAALTEVRSRAQTLIGLARDEDWAGVAGVSGEAIRAARSLKRRWEALDRRSPYRRYVLPTALALLTDAAEAVSRHGVAAEGPLHELRADLNLMIARDAAADLIAEARGNRNLRELARETGLGLGYLSDLQTGKVGPPSERAAAALDRAMGTSLAELVAEARATARELRAQARVANRAITVTPSARRSDADRLSELTMALASDRALQDLLERLIGMPARARAGLLSFLVSTDDE
jgi:transcriptional regulator with XRE-family HTH domain